MELKKILSVVFFVSWGAYFTGGVAVPLARSHHQAESRLALVRERVRKAQDFQARFAGRMTKKIDAPSFGVVDTLQALSRLEGFLASCGLTLKSLKRKSDKRVRAPFTGRVTAWEVAARGPEAAWIRLIAKIDGVGFMCRIASLRLRPDHEPGDTLEGAMTLEKIDGLKDFKTVPDDKLLESYLEGLEAKESLERISGKKMFKRLIPPAAPAQVAAGGAEDPLRGLSLVGVIDDGGRKAVIRDEKTARSYVLEVRQAIAGLTVVEIADRAVVLSADRGVVLEKDGARYSLTL